VNGSVLDWCLAHEEDMIDALKAYLRLPSVSTDGAYESGMEAARSWLEAYLANLGFEGIRRLDGGGHPALFAERLDAPPGSPTLLVYAHYDVQPPDPIEAWTSPPFEPTVRRDRLYARGASDDKGPAMIALHALAGFIAVDGRLPVNVKLLLEGEEETGSPSLPRLLESHRELLVADAVLSADGARWRADRPSLNVGSRGNGGLGFTVRTASKDLHSGRYGGAVPNALHVLADIVAGLHGADGRVAIDGFHDGIEEPGAGERATIARIDFDEGAWLDAVGAKASGESGYATLERLWTRPTLEVNGMWGGYLGDGAKTVVPCEAHAKLTTRLVTGQDPVHVESALRRHLEAACPAHASLDIEAQHGWTGAYTLPDDHWLLCAAEAALTATSGVSPARVRIGATLPLMSIVRDTLGIETVMFSFSTADEDYHAPDEFLRLRSVREGLAAWTALLAGPFDGAPAVMPDVEGGGDSR